MSHDSGAAGCNPHSGNSRGRHPPHLKGKEIGLWYARRQQNKNAKIRTEKRSLVCLDADAEHKLQRLLNMDSTKVAVQNHRPSSYDVTTPHNFRKHNCDPDPALDEKLLKKSMDDKHSTRLQDFRRKLPTFKMKQEIIDAIENNPVVVISGDTGCGKTTQIPQYILDHYIQNGKGSSCSIVCTQPRRISAIGVAERVAVERSERCGQGSVGFQIRLESQIGRDKGSILYCTTGIMLKWLESDRLLKRTSHIFLDEVHERSTHSDYLLIVLKDILVARPDLKVVLMSATLNAEVFSKYFNDCPMLHVPGLMYDVQQVFLEDILAETRYRIESQNDSRGSWKRGKKSKGGGADVEKMKLDRYADTLRNKYPADVIRSLKNLNEDEIDIELATALITHICTTKPIGAILVFLTGWNVIKKLNEALTSQRHFSSRQFKIIPLHSLMPTVNQREVFDAPADGVWKIILATSIAETSITINDVKYVIDCGKIKQHTFDTNANLMMLQEEMETKANATQRRGRAGRVQEGICYHLFPKFRWNKMLDFQVPEMLRTRLEELCLQIKLMKLGEIVPFLSRAIEPPSINAVNLSVEFLKTLNALDENENLTPLGYHLARLPVDPQTGKMILFGAMCSCLDPVTTVAASLSYKDAFIIPLGKEGMVDEIRGNFAEDSRSDHIMLANAYKGWEEATSRGNARQYCWKNYLSQNTLQLLSSMKQQFATLLKDLNFVDVADPKSPQANLNSDNEKLIKAVICAGLYPNVAKIKQTECKNSYRPRLTAAYTAQKERAEMHPSSVNAHQGYFESPWVVYHEKLKSTATFLHDTTMVSPFSLLLFGGGLTNKEENGRCILAVDQWIQFWCSKKQTEIIKELRKQLDELLESKISSPGPTKWTVVSQESNFLRAVRELLTSEEILPATE